MGQSPTSLTAVGVSLTAVSWLPQDPLSWVALAIALLSAYLSWAKRAV
jgi:hypothetical protein